MDDRDPNSHQDHELLPDAKEELKGMLRDGIAHPSTKPVLTGAVVGAVAAGLLPVITWPFGLLAGAGVVLYKRIRP